MISTATELAYRRNGDIAVGRYWDRPTGELNVFVADLAWGEAFELPVAPDRALDGFHHPYAYAASAGVKYRAAAPALYV